MTLIDTADAYGPHTNEELVGRALAGGHRGRAVVATKVGLLTDSVEVANPGGSPQGRPGRPPGTRAGVDRRQPAPGSAPTTWTSISCTGWTRGAGGGNLGRDGESLGAARRGPSG